jgi:hypothetical protein
MALATISTAAIQLLRIYLELMRMGGRSPEEVDAFYLTERTKFYGPNAPENLPKPPE